MTISIDKIKYLLKYVKKTNLFIVGAPRTGTTSIHNYLSYHKEIFVGEEKEPYYFCNDFHSEDKKMKFFKIRNLISYLMLYKGYKNEKYIVDGSTFYLYSKNAAENIFKFNEKAKIIIIVREPVSQLSSYYSYLIKQKFENIKDFDIALKSEKNRKIGLMNNEYKKYTSCLFYSDIPKYKEQITRYLKFFKKENIKILVYDDLEKDSITFSKEILDFLKLDDSLKDDKKIGKKNFMRKEYVINANTTLQLKKFFKRDVKYLSKLLSRDLLTEWGYNEV
ncbi:MAG: sulfotransferase [Candidatus Gracilibacteria bacterium]